ncbi:DNA topoisomerase I [Pelomyxa schiedti]|nr:DNA topoisomerase I [Pelomyxa schiedti]
MQNFFHDFKLKLKEFHDPAATIITDFSLCDFTKIHAYLNQQSQVRKLRTQEEINKEKVQKEQLREKYGWATVDGKKERIANFTIEPPGLFLGRGQHPLAGHIKERVMPEDVTINIGRGEDIPPCPIEGHNWNQVVHNNEVAWLAFWREKVNGVFKYIWLHPSFSLQGASVMEKYEKARKLALSIDQIREAYSRGFISSDPLEKQRSTALYFIDRLALCVGNEKVEADAGTIGCCTLCVEHIKLSNSPEPCSVSFDFLAKDSMHYQNTIQVCEPVFNNLKEFTTGKAPSESLFSALSTTLLNHYIQSFMEGLSAKVFRTYNASFTLEQELNNDPPPAEASLEIKLQFYNNCIKQVAVLCGHMNPVNEIAFSASKKRFEAELLALNHEKKMILKQLWKLNGKPTEDGMDVEVSPGKGETDPAVTIPDSTGLCAKRLVTIEQKVAQIEGVISSQGNTETYALGTSKLNYLDPRISVSWCKKVGLPIERVFSSLREKFSWAMNAENFRF